MRLRTTKTLGYMRFVKMLFIVLIVSVISVIVACLNEDFPPWLRSHFFRVDLHEIARNYAEDDTVHIDSKLSEKLYKEVRVLCIILTTHGNLNNRIAVVNSTWAKRCNKRLYVLCTDKTSPDILNTCHIDEGKSHLTGKVRYAFEHSYKNYLNDFDWFFKGDDDTYVVMENLRFLLSNYSPHSPGSLGYHFKVELDQGFHSGGAGYVLSRQGLRQLVEGGFSTNSCLKDGGGEDVEIAKCLQRASVPVLSSLDKFDRDTFHPEKPWQHIFGLTPSYLVQFVPNLKIGTGCCSQFVISFHHVDAQTIIFMDHLLYRTSVYGRLTPENISSMFKVGKVYPNIK